MHLLVVRKNDCSCSNIPRNRVFPAWLPHPSLVVRNDLYKDHNGFIYCLIYSLWALMFQHIMIRIKIGVLLDMWMCKKMSFHIFGHFGPNSFFLVTMTTSNKLRERNIAYLNYKYNQCSHLNRASSKCNQRKTHISLKGFNFTFLIGQISIFVIFLAIK